jgi:putative hydrolase of the HAD superfamily
MIEAVFFDLYHTLIRYEPPREQILSGTLASHGIDAGEQSLKTAIIAGDEYFYRENARKSLSRRSDAETSEMWLSYGKIVLEKAGIQPNRELVAGVLADMQRTKFERVLFSDVLPALGSLSSAGMTMGLISNIDKDIGPLLDDLGLTPFLKVVMTSKEAGATKPEPLIFLEAVKRSGKKADQVLFVGDQYEIDVAGARNAGLNALLLDRDNYYTGIPSEEKIKSLEEIKGRINL